MLPTQPDTIAMRSALPCTCAQRNVAPRVAEKRRLNASSIRVQVTTAREQSAVQPNSSTVQGRTFSAAQSQGTYSSHVSPSKYDANADLVQAVARAAAEKLADGLQLLATAARLLTAGLQPLPEGFPPGPSGDVALLLLQNPLSFLKETAAAYGNTVGLVLGGEQVVLVADPTLARDVMIKQATVFVKEGTAFFPGSSLAGEGLLVSDGQLWQRQRQLANPAFRTAAVATYAQAMVDATQRMLTEQWAKDGPRDVYADFNALTLQITVEALFGADVRGSDSETITDAIRTAFQWFAGRAASGFMVPEWVPTWENVQYNTAVARLNSTVYSLIRQRRAQTAKAAAPAQDLLHNLLAAKDERGEGMTDKSLRDELMTFLVAGQETSAILLGWTASLLALHPEGQARAAWEVASALGGAAPAAGNLGNLPFLEAVVLESLRLFPPAYLVGRCACLDARLGPWSLPAGTTVLVSPYLMHRDPLLWERPDDFLPQRWLSPDGSRVAPWRTVMSGLGPNGAYVPFGAGPRNCIGTGFAMMEAVLVLASILQRCDLLPDPSLGAAVPDPRITLRPKAVPLMLRRRTH